MLASGSPNQLRELTNAANVTPVSRYVGLSTDLFEATMEPAWPVAFDAADF
jgi:hypothetical protein